MKFGRLIWLIVVFVALPLASYAQDATISGTVKDNTGGVLPGVTVTAVNEASGISFNSVTDEHGLYRIPVRAGVYKITLPGAGENANATGDFDITNPLTIIGQGANATAIDGGQLDRVFDVIGTFNAGRLSGGIDSALAGRAGAGRARLLS